MHLSQQLREDRALRMRLASPRELVNRLKAHFGHQSPDAMTPDNRSFPAQVGSDLAAAENGYSVNARSISLIIASVSVSIPTGVY